jgi:hypothetical protein
VGTESLHVLAKQAMDQNRFGDCKVLARSRLLHRLRLYALNELGFWSGLVGGVPGSRGCLRDCACFVSGGSAAILAEMMRVNLLWCAIKRSPALIRACKRRKFAFAQWARESSMASDEMALRHITSGEGLTGVIGSRLGDRSSVWAESPGPKERNPCRAVASALDKSIFDAVDVPSMGPVLQV